MVRVLVIDDDPSIVNIVCILLRRAGYHCETATTAVDGIEMAEEKKFDAVIVDMRMPGVNGLEVLKAIRNTPIIAMSGAPADEETDFEILAASLGGVAFLYKPFSPAQLVEVVSTAVGTPGAH